MLHSIFSTMKVTIKEELAIPLEELAIKDCHTFRPMVKPMLALLI